MVVNSCSNVSYYYCIRRLDVKSNKKYKKIHHTRHNIILQIPLAAINENYGYDEGSENAAAAGEVSHSLVPVSQSSRELSPRLAREYKEAFGGLQQNEPGSALARFKRIKRVLRVSSD